MRSSRRRFLSAIGMTGTALTLERLLGAQSIPAPAGGRLIATMPLGRLDGLSHPPLHQLLGDGLDARQFTDLAEVGAERLITPTEHFYIRTAHPSSLTSPAADWRLTLAGDAGQERMIDLATLRSLGGPTGVHVMECSGNGDPANFGLLSAASWSGVPLGALLDRLPGPATGRRILVTGVDDDSRRWQTSLAGASWLFTSEELERTGAFLATGMNGNVLTPDHGAPLRLVVPGYYGCSCIKWVSRIDIVADEAPATMQMKEFANRTHQTGIPDLARDYEPPVIDLAATPVRVEQWTSEDHPIFYRVVGIRWGGFARKAPLMIRFRREDPFVPVDECPDSDGTTTWSVWSHRWHPVAAGRYQIALSVADRSIRTRRLDISYYAREVEIDRI